MSHYFLFYKKELLEYWRTYKLLIMLSVFVIFGMMNPLVAKLTPELLESFLPEGMTITLPEPSSLDSWAQFFNNIQQIGLIVLVLVFSGVLANELSQGTLINLLTKGLARHAVVVAKYLAMLSVWSVSLILSFLVTLVYTLYLFPDGKSSNLLFAVFCLWLFGALLLAVLLFATTLVRSNYGGLLFTGVVVMVLMILNIAPIVQKYNPLALVTQSMALVANTVELSSLNYPIGLAVIGSLVMVILAVLVFSKKQL